MSLAALWDVSAQRQPAKAYGFDAGRPNFLDAAPLHQEFAMPSVANPVQFLDQYTDEASPDYKIKIAHGTTTLGFKYQGGVVIAVDSRATAGNVVASQTVKKIIEINPYLLGTMAGGAADCAYWERELGRRCRLYELRNKERISVAAASKMLANMVFSYRGMGLSMGTMVTGWDKTVYLFDRLFTIKYPDDVKGAGSTHAYGVLDGEYHYDLTESEAIDLGRRAIYHATFRDAFSGGSVRVYHVYPEGWKAISLTDVYDLHYEYQDGPKPALK